MNETPITDSLKGKIAECAVINRMKELERAANTLRDAAVSHVAAKEHYSHFMSDTNLRGVHQTQDRFHQALAQFDALKKP